MIAKSGPLNFYLITASLIKVGSLLSLADWRNPLSPYIICDVMDYFCIIDSFINYEPGLGAIN